MSVVDPGLYSAALRPAPTEPLSAADAAEQKFVADHPEKKATLPESFTRQRIAAFFIACGVAVGVGVFVFGSDINGAGPARNRVGFSASNIITDSAVGSEVRVSDYVPSGGGSPTPPPAATATPAPITNARRVQGRAAAWPSGGRAPAERPTWAERSPTVVKDEPDEDEGEVLYDENDPDASIVVPAAVAPAALVVNIGERIPSRLIYPIVTAGGNTVPVTAVVTQDVLVGEQIAIPAGARLAGQAFATTANDRVQILFQAVVISGRTVPVSGVAFGDDSELGLAGKVLRKGSPLKGLGGRVAGAFGRALTYATYAGYGTALSQATVAGNLVGGAANDLERVGSDWVLSSKVVRVQPDKALVVYIASDLRVNDSILALGGAQ